MNAPTERSAFSTAINGVSHSKENSVRFAGNPYVVTTAVKKPSTSGSEKPSSPTISIFRIRKLGTIKSDMPRSLMPETLLLAPKKANSSSFDSLSPLSSRYRIARVVGTMLPE